MDTKSRLSTSRNIRFSVGRQVLIQKFKQDWDIGKESWISELHRYMQGHDPAIGLEDVKRWIKTHEWIIKPLEDASNVNDLRTSSSKRSESKKEPTINEHLSSSKSEKKSITRNSKTLSATTSETTGSTPHEINAPRQTSIPASTVRSDKDKPQTLAIGTTREVCPSSEEENKSEASKESEDEETEKEETGVVAVKLLKESSNNKIPAPKSSQPKSETSTKAFESKLNRRSRAASEGSKQQQPKTAATHKAKKSATLTFGSLKRMNFASTLVLESKTSNTIVTQSVPLPLVQESSSSPEKEDKEDKAGESENEENDKVGIQVENPGPVPVSNPSQDGEMVDKLQFDESMVGVRRWVLTSRLHSS